MLVVQIALGVALGIIIAVACIKNYEVITSAALRAVYPIFKWGFVTLSLIYMADKATWIDYFAREFSKPDKGLEGWVGLIFGLVLAFGLVIKAGELFNWIIAGKAKDNDTELLFYSALFVDSAFFIEWVIDSNFPSLDGFTVVLVVLGLAVGYRYVQNKRDVEHRNLKGAK